MFLPCVGFGAGLYKAESMEMPLSLFSPLSWLPGGQVPGQTGPGEGGVWEHSQCPSQAQEAAEALATRAAL